MRFFAVNIIADCEGKTLKAQAFAGTNFGQDMYDQPGRVLEVDIPIFEDVLDAMKSFYAKNSKP